MRAASPSVNFLQLTQHHKFQTVFGPGCTWEGQTQDPEMAYVPTFQIRITPNGEWHRLGVVHGETACGLTYTSRASRDYDLTGELCNQCHTPHELRLAAAATAPVDGDI